MTTHVLSHPKDLAFHHRSHDGWLAQQAGSHNLQHFLHGFQVLSKQVFVFSVPRWTDMKIPASGLGYASPCHKHRTISDGNIPVDCLCGCDMVVRASMTASLNWNCGNSRTATDVKSELDRNLTLPCSDMERVGEFRFVVGMDEQDLPLADTRPCVKKIASGYAACS